jgi:hypothetical protein
MSLARMGSNPTHAGEGSGSDLENLREACFPSLGLRQV